MFTQSNISVLLGRPLSSTETTNFTTYLSMARSKVSAILCTSICEDTDTKTFMPRSGYRTLNLPIFSEIYLITVNGIELSTSDYTPYQGSSMNGEWFNSIVFETEQTEKIEIEAFWGFAYTPEDIQLMVAEQFAIASSTHLSDALVSSKKVEDFSISFRDTTIQQAFLDKHISSIVKYSACLQGNIQSGNVRSGYGYARHIL